VESNSTILTNNLTVAQEIALGSIALSVVPGSSTTNGAYYTVSRTGTASNGSTIRVETTGENLNQSGSEYVSASLITVGSSYGVSAAGTPVSGLPVGTHTYTGRASVIDASSVGDGTFVMSANFNTNSATIASTVPSTDSNPAFFFSATSVQINPTNGQFSTSNALIGQTGATSEAASINGHFAGTNAVGVHGLIYTNNANAPTYVGTFAGSR
jgi:hypothetical protein